MVATWRWSPIRARRVRNIEQSWCVDRRHGRIGRHRKESRLGDCLSLRHGGCLVRQGWRRAELERDGLEVLLEQHQVAYGVGSSVR
jgi:hypothetical protein